MTANLLSFPLFYRRPVPLDPKRDAGAQLPLRRDMVFAAGANSIPLVLGELAEVARCYPILFSREAKPVPIALVGLTGDRNLFVEPATDHPLAQVWRERSYVPGYVRRYPFILMETPQTDRFTVCVDAEGLVTGETGEGAPLFNADGSPSEVMQRGIEFCKLYHTEYARTREWVDALQAENLLVEHRANIDTGKGEPFAFTGFQVIDIERFNALPDATFLDWRARGWLEPIYLHRASALNWDRLIALSPELHRGSAS